MENNEFYDTQNIMDMRVLNLNRCYLKFKYG